LPIPSLKREFFPDLRRGNELAVHVKVTQDWVILIEAEDDLSQA